MPTIRTMKNAINDTVKVTIYLYFLQLDQIVTNTPYSHSMVAGGLLDTS
jgi:hypothetical protein